MKIRTQCKSYFKLVANIIKKKLELDRGMKKFRRILDDSRELELVNIGVFTVCSSNIGSLLLPVLTVLSFISTSIWNTEKTFKKNFPFSIHFVNFLQKRKVL